MIRLSLASLFFASAFSLACASVQDEDLAASSDGMAGAGALGTGATAATGGFTAATGGVSGASGGATSTGGVFGLSGGTTGAGGSAATGGGTATGGASATGGTSGTGGAGTGGAATGGGSGLDCPGAVDWVAAQNSVNYAPGQLFKYMGKVYSYDGTTNMTYVHEACPPVGGESWCTVPWTEKTSC